MAQGNNCSVHPDMEYAANLISTTTRSIKDITPPQPGQSRTLFHNNPVNQGHYSTTTRSIKDIIPQQPGQSRTLLHHNPVNQGHYSTTTRSIKDITPPQPGQSRTLLHHNPVNQGHYSTTTRSIKDITFNLTIFPIAQIFKIFILRHTSAKVHIHTMLFSIVASCKNYPNFKYLPRTCFFGFLDILI